MLQFYYSFIVIAGKLSIKESPKKDAVIKDVKKLGLIAGGTGKLPKDYVFS